MKEIEFQLQNGIIYTGYTNGTAFMGEELIHVTEDVRRQMLRDIARSAGIRPLPNPHAVAKKLNSARRGYNDNLIPIWGVPNVILRGLGVIEYARSAELSDESNYKEVVLNGHYFDVVQQAPEEMKVGEVRGMEGGVVMTYWGQHDSLSEALQRIEGLGASDRKSVLTTEPDHDIASSKVIERRYKSAHRKVGNLCDYVPEVPLDVIKGDADFAERWAKQVLAEAEVSDPDIAWYMGITPLMVEIDRLKAAMNETAA